MPPLCTGTQADLLVDNEKKEKERKIESRCEQGSNLRGETPLDFKSNALTTRPSQHGQEKDHPESS